MAVPLSPCTIFTMSETAESSGIVEEGGDTKSEPDDDQQQVCNL